MSMEENDSNMSVFDERDNGEIKSVNIFAVTFHPSAMLGILKIIHAKFTNKKVIVMRPTRTIPLT